MWNQGKSWLKKEPRNEGGREAARQRDREAGRQGGREAGRQGDRETGKEGKRQRGSLKPYKLLTTQKDYIIYVAQKIIYGGPELTHELCTNL